MYNFKLLAELAGSLMNGESCTLEEVIRNKLEHMGEEFIKEAIAQILPGSDLIARGQAAAKTGGMSEINRLRSHWLNPGSGGEIGDFATRAKAAYRTGGTSELNSLRRRILGSDGSAVAKRIEDAFFGKLKDRSYGSIGSDTIDKKKWSQSRQDWLNEGWKHDWRSQPRDWHGRWKPGRLKHPYMSKGARRIRTKRRAAARKAAKQAWQRENL